MQSMVLQTRRGNVYIKLLSQSDFSDCFGYRTDPTWIGSIPNFPESQNTYRHTIGSTHTPGKLDNLPYNVDKDKQGEVYVKKLQAIVSSSTQQHVLWIRGAWGLAHGHKGLFLQKKVSTRALSSVVDPDPKLVAGSGSGKIITDPGRQ